MASTETSAAELQSQIQVAAEDLGDGMDIALPFKSSWFWRIIHGVQFSERILVPVQGEEAVFTRAWLERPAAKTAADSPIELLTDKVKVNPTLLNQRNQFASEPEVAAVYSPHTGLKLNEVLGAPQEHTLERIQLLGSYVTAISEAELHKELKQAVPTHGLKQMRVLEQ